MIKNFGEIISLILSFDISKVSDKTKKKLSDHISKAKYTTGDIQKASKSAVCLWKWVFHLNNYFELVAQSEIN